jgi:hypothetical protein
VEDIQVNMIEILGNNLEVQVIVSLKVWFEWVEKLDQVVERVDGLENQFLEYNVCTARKADDRHVMKEISEKFVHNMHLQVHLETYKQHDH